MVKSIFTVIEGNERTYIHPISVDEVNPTNNHLQFLITPEFALHQRGDNLSNWVGFKSFMYQCYSRSWLSKLLDRARYQLAVWKFIVRHRLFRYASDTYDFVNPVFCSDICNVHISVPGAMHVSGNGMKLTDSCYLIPSHKYLEQKLRNWLFQDNLEYPIIDTKDRNDYLKWAAEQTKLGRRIVLLSSLDT